MSKKQLILDLFAKDMIKFGEFTLKSGKKSYIYADIRTSISYPSLFKQICNEYSKIMANIQYDMICGVPYSALAIASAIAYDKSIPMLLKRKEVKEYGTKKILEGYYNPGQNCLLIEDVISTGASLIETTIVLEEHRLKVTDVCTLIDRNQGGREAMQQHGYKLHSIMNLTEIIDVLYAENKISANDKKNALALL
ncbi:MAG: orotate phosphoribosyltransferase [Burkholderiales bacterium]|jgi:uridine monophosphate synthetase|nr:orotate phosphoribosyltransferase [Burkholderiales bacterium]